MIKKLALLICVITLAVIPQQITYAAEELQDETVVLQDLGLLSDTSVTYESLVYSLSGFLYENPQEVGTAEVIARQTGMIGETEEFSARQKPTLGEAVKYAAATLGYKDYAESLGGYPEGYRKIALDTKLTSGITDEWDKKLSYDNMVKLLYAMTEAPPMVYCYDVAAGNYKIAYDSNLLELNRDIYKINGIMTANEFTSIYRASGTASDKYIVLNDTDKYLVLDNSFDSFLGYSVEAYIQKNDNDEDIVFSMKKRKNNVIEIKDEDIYTVLNDLSEVQYLNDADVKRSAKLEPALRVIYNGVYYGSYTASDLKPDIGTITLIDNDNDNKYEVAIVKSYQTIVVKGVDTTDKVITNALKFAGSLAELDLGSTARDVHYNIYAQDGTEASLANITTGSILSVAVSKGTDKAVAEIYISGSNGQDGILYQINNADREIDVDGEVYRMSQDFTNHSTANSLKVGNSYIFFTDFFGNMVYFKTDRELDYVLVLKIQPDDTDDRGQLVYMDLSGNWYTVKLAEYVTLDTQRISAAAASASLGEFEPQIMKVKTNKYGEIKSIDTAIVSDVYVKDEFTKTSEQEYTYRMSPNSLGMYLYPRNDAVIVVIPADKKDKNGYYVRTTSGFFTSDRPYKVTAYDVTEFGVSSLFTVNENESMIKNLMNKSMFVVTGISTKLVDDEVLPVLEGNLGVYKNMTVIGNTTDVFSSKGIKPGDIVNLNINAKGRVDFASKIQISTATDYYQKDLFIEGTVIDIDLEDGAIRFTHGANQSRLRIKDTVPVIYYDSSTKTCEDKKATALKANDKFIMRVSFGTIYEIVCIQ